MEVRFIFAGRVLLPRYLNRGGILLKLFLLQLHLRFFGGSPDWAMSTLMQRLCLWDFFA